MHDSADQDALAATMEQVGAGAIKRNKIRIIAFGRANRSENAAVHFATNEKLLELVKEDRVTQCIHVTGEMRALSDPFHRRVCAEISKRTGAKVTVVYDIPDTHRDSPIKIAEWNADKWGTERWIDRLSAFSLIGDNVVDAYACNTPEKIQFTVFGNRYVQLQERHRDGDVSRSAERQTPKRVWLVESEELNELLLQKAIRTVSESNEIPDVLFKRFLVSVCGGTSQEIIRRLLVLDGGGSREAILDDRLRYFDKEIDNRLLALVAMGFIISNGKSNIELTDIGRRYFEALEA